MDSKRVREAGDLILACSTILLFYISFPGGYLPWIGWLAPVPLGLAIHGKNSREAFVISTFTAFFCWAAATWWLVPGIIRSADTPFNISLFFEFLFCLTYAIPYGIAGLLVSKMGWVGTIRDAAKAALLWTAISGFMPHVLPGNIAHTQYRYPIIIQIVELGGIPVLLFLMYLVTWLCVAAIVNFKRSLKYTLGAFLLAGIVIAGTAVYGHFRLITIKQQLNAPETKQLTVGWIQPNFIIKGRNPGAWDKEVKTVEAMTYDLAKKNPALDLIVWPEMPPPISYSGDDDDQALIDRLISDIKIPMLVTGYLQGTTEENGYYNTIEFVRKSGRTDIYLKQRLLPFGEYLPGEKQFPFLRKLFPNALNYISGNDDIIFHFNSDVKLIPLICYEVIFPAIVAERKAKGGNLIINPVNDAWFGNSNGPEIHLALALFRAVEFRLPIVRVTNSGISAVINAGGEFDSTSVTPLFKQCVVFATVAIPQTSSVYAMTGDLFLWGCALVSLILLGVDIIKSFSFYRSERKDN